LQEQSYPLFGVENKKVVVLKDTRKFFYYQEKDILWPF